MLAVGGSGGPTQPPRQHPPCELPATGRFTPQQHQQGHRRMLLHLESPLHGSRLQLCCRGAASVSPSSLQQYLAPTHSTNPAPRGVPVGWGRAGPGQVGVVRSLSELLGVSSCSWLWRGCGVFFRRPEVSKAKLRLGVGRLHSPRKSASSHHCTVGS